MTQKTPDGFIKIIDDTGELLREAQPRSDNSILNEWQKKYANGVLKFTEKELSKMPKKIKNLFRVGTITAHIRKKSNGVYEIRCQIQNEKIAVSSKDLNTAKEKFIEALNKLFSSPGIIRINRHVKFNDYMQQWLDTVKRPAVKDTTFKEYVYTTNKYINPEFEGKELISIKGFEIQAFINRFTEAEKFKTAQKIYNLLSPVFEYAVIDDIIQKSPMQRISIPRYEQSHGVSLTRAEEKFLIDKLLSEKSIYAQTFVLIMYTGVRRSELASIDIKDGWIYVTTSKQRKGLKEKRRSLPIPPMLQKVIHLIDVQEVKKLKPDIVTNHMKDFFTSHHVHELRHTFITRCQECGIQRELVSVWVGHSADNSQTSTVYTHLDQYREHQLEEMKKFDYTLV